MPTNSKRSTRLLDLILFAPIFLLSSLTHANSSSVQFDRIPGGIVLREEKLEARDLTFVCQASKVKSSAECLAAARSHLPEVCNFKISKTEKNCVRRTVKEDSRSARPFVIDEWWCSVESESCTTEKRTCPKGSKSLTVKSNPRIAFYYKVCSAPAAVARPSRQGPTEGSRNIK